MVGFMEFAGLFFSWWGFFMGVVLGFGTAFLSALAVTPLVYRAKRRRELRRMWRMDRPRSMAMGIMPSWSDYDPADETVDRRCVCHNRRIYEGERVLLWPEIGPMGIVHTSVYCESVKESV
jgi:hypothetical protein